MTFYLNDWVKGHVVLSRKDMVFVNDAWDKIKLKYMKAWEC